MDSVQDDFRTNWEHIEKLQTKIDLCPTLIWKAFVFENGF
ncbi:hypothetical protein LEP1GSC062_2666 [Leptospira alexanderi serovar Manhao 3 str. L 60]|uniref:Uncharacterized protein n=1 Tax=Leptospira alexanderi serovar Manhao 3 str. L 60 TaxID=1049759 RepID=V6I6E5_9LEPT|nr:hypothetical protein LEP1GSC062_2666 [Leptospira alexanderi serovar Manhao 3 str. L 60]